MRPTWLSMFALAILGACSATEGAVLSSLSADGGGDGDASAQNDASNACARPPAACRAAPAPGTITICGRVVDLETSALIVAGSGGLGDSLDVSIFDPLNIDDDNNNSAAVVKPNACGWYFAEQISGLRTGFAAIVIDDAKGSASDTLARTGSLVRAQAGQLVLANAFALRNEVDQRWSASAGLSGGTFGSRGAFMPIFIDLNQPPVGVFQGTPVAGVTISRNGIGLGNEDYYFADSAPLQRMDIQPALETTGSNGSGLLPDLALTTKSGGSKSGCSFAEANSLALPTIVQVQELDGTCN